MPRPRKLPRTYGIDGFSRRSNRTSEAPQRRHIQGRLPVATDRFPAALPIADAPVIIQGMEDCLEAYHSVIGAHEPTSAQPLVAVAQERTFCKNKQSYSTVSRSLADDTSATANGAEVMIAPEPLSDGLPCPFAVADSSRYRCCDTNTMLTNGAVARHLRKHHRQPPYCPTCQATFKSRTLRDGHIRLRKCKLMESTHLEGLDVRQFNGLRQYVHTSDASRTTWDQISQLVSTPCFRP